MNSLRCFFCRRARPLTALGLVAVLYWLARPPDLESEERSELAGHFRFVQSPLPEIDGSPRKKVRAVHPSLEHISAWISSVGAAVALGDLDGDGLPNDLCYVDPRTDQVIVAPVPGTGARYQAFALTPDPLPYDPATTAPMGCLFCDLNEDGLMDILVYYWGRTPVAFLRKQPASPGQPLSRSDFVPCEIVPNKGAPERWNTNAATMADLDGDGHLDLVIGNYFPDGARILDARASGGEAMQHSMSRAFNGGHKHLLRWVGATQGARPSVRFEDVQGVLDEEVARGWTLAVGAADLDGDLLPELYFANDFGPDRLLHNRSTPGHFRFAVVEGRKGFTTPSSFVLGRDSFKGMGVDFGDLNGDGLLDIYVSNIASQWALQESHFVWLSTGETQLFREGIAPYVQASERLGLSHSAWAWESRLGDFDNDGVLEALQATGFLQGDASRWPELHELATANDQLLSNPSSWHRFQLGDDLDGHVHNPFFVRSRSGRYYDLASDIAGLGQPMVSRGIATADVDGDGLLDFAVANQWGTSYFYRNVSKSAGAFLGLHLLLPLQRDQPGATKRRRGHPGPDLRGRPAVGAAATVFLPDGRKLVAQVDGGNGHSGKRSPDLHFGLGRSPITKPVQVNLKWRDPNGRVRSETLYLAPGWHTVLLGWPSGEAAEERS